MPFSHSFLVINSKKAAFRRHPFQFDTFVRLIRGGLKELHDSNEIPQTALRESCWMEERRQAVIGIQAPREMASIVLWRALVALTCACNEVGNLTQSLKKS